MVEIGELQAQLPFLKAALLEEEATQTNVFKGSPLVKNGCQDSASPLKAPETAALGL